MRREIPISPEEVRRLQTIAVIHTAFEEKFGIPRQSGVVPETRAEIVFEKPYQNPDALRGVEGFSHLWLIWGFSACERDAWSPTVRPPRLGGNARMGVFATRSPFRPNPIGLSSVTLEEVRLHTPEGPVLVVGGADLMDGTPIYDIKPYLPYADCHPEATGGFAEEKRHYALTVDFPAALEAQIDYRAAAIGGKDSMSGSFEKLHVPPTLVSFAVGVCPADACAPMSSRRQATGSA